MATTASTERGIDMNDGQREIDTELRAEAASDQESWALTCDACGARFAEFQDLDAHHRLDCNAEDWETFWLDMAAEYEAVLTPDMAKA
jgi:hypothetical protein